MSELLFRPSIQNRPVGQAILTGIRQKCPNCKTAKLFRAYLKPVDVCANCGEEIFHQRADDAPPYFTILIVAHIIVPAMLVVEKTLRPELWTHAAIWLPLTLVLSLAILPLAKGALINLQWALRMHGFDPDHREPDHLDDEDFEIETC